MDWSEMRRTADALQRAINEAIASKPTHEQLVAVVAALGGTMGTITLHLSSLSEAIEELDRRVRRLEEMSNGSA